LLILLTDCDISNATGLANGRDKLINAPKSYKKWVKSGVYTPLRAPTVKKVRTKEEQLPNNKNDESIIKTVYDYYSTTKTAYDFEFCAIQIAKLMDKNIVECDRTRSWRDGGRDAVGKYRIGEEQNGIEVEFALEAKRYSKGVGIKDTSRLISRLRHRQFGIFVTTSYLGDQAYKEIIEDQHPVIVVSAVDIVKILKSSGYDNPGKVKKWLEGIESNR
jgi:hypothetical protein